MSRRLPPLNWLRAYEASARHLSFTNAAQELFVTQAAISKQVKLLEHHLGELLFERRPRSLILTKVGEAYLPKVQDAFQRLGAGTEEVFGKSRSETLTVRAQVGFAVNWIASRLPRFFAAHPDMQIRIVSSVWERDMDTEKFDLDISYGTGNWPGFLADRITWETICPLCTPETAQRLKEPDDLANERLLHVLGYQDGWGAWLTAAGATKVDSGSGAHFDTTLMALEVAANNAGVALGRHSMTGPEIDSGRLVRPFDLALPITEGFFLLTPEEGADHPDAQLLRDWLLQEAQAARENRW